MADGDEKSHLKTQFSLVIILAVLALKVIENISIVTKGNLLHMRIIWHKNTTKKSEIPTSFHYKNRKTCRMN